MKNLSKFIFLLLSISAFAQEKLSLENCYILVEKNYPLAKQTDLLAKQNELDVAVIKTEKFPQLDFLAQATYQSDVTQIPIAIPNSTIEPPNKDQYKTTVSVNQLIYAGGLIDASAEVKLASLKTKQKQVEVSLYQLKKQINQLYFSILLQQEKKALLTSKKELLEAKLKEVKAGVKYGVLLSSSNSVLEAELLKIEQQFTEIEFNKTSLFETLSHLIGAEISNTTALKNPEFLSKLTSEIKRPELDLFKLKKEQIETSEQLNSLQNVPKIMGFVIGGYGNPGLNMLDNSFQTFYMTGVKLNWTIFDWKATKKQSESLLINKDIITTEEEIFKLNTNIELNQQQAEINKITSLIESDNSIIKLRNKIVKSAESQLKNGVITASAYITELTNLYEAQNNLNTHKIQLLLAKATYKVTQGN
ncbi:TolC family protein [Lutibacter flavus]|uniref:Outer membrane protein TolC n=1 Tax=Lutibacter flavus TaxID=691689 RepID=A0A238WVX9_9FLAO|nr:TolC family protein [Lutibacter flavus]SNR50765.1 Outer membrane protein TolC [Lutibacter flavus]